MNKKIVALFLFVFCIIAIVAIGVFGKIPDPPSSIAVEVISFKNYEYNDDGEKIIYIQRGKSTYQLEWEINPQDATDQTVSFVILSNETFVEINKEGLITFFQEVPITVKIQSNEKDKKEDTVIIEFIGNTSSDEENPF
ncbi:MAG: hypothetical protein GX661_03755 [Acholeplasmataceae bacterium]|nr:hypothetical protein [Acholeplasmataceae bacterium]